jgi:hypothetical protein
VVPLSHTDQRRHHHHHHHQSLTQVACSLRKLLWSCSLAEHKSVPLTIILDVANAAIDQVDPDRFNKCRYVRCSGSASLRTSHTGCMICRRARCCDWETVTPLPCSIPFTSIGDLSLKLPWRYGLRVKAGFLLLGPEQTENRRLLLEEVRSLKSLLARSIQVLVY